MSIYEYLKYKTPEELAALNYELPDSCELTQEENNAWIPGAYEGTVLRSDMRIKQNVILNYYIAGRIKKYVLHPSEALYKKIERFPVKYSAISLADPICSICVALKLTKTQERRASLRELSKRLMLESSKREAVKFGTALLGISGSPENAELVMPIGMHDEFTLYAAGTISRLLENAVNAVCEDVSNTEKLSKNKYLTELAENLHGWGKIAVMYELDYSDPQIRIWTLKNGCSNNIGLSYLANLCAIKGRMADILREICSGSSSAISSDLSPEDEKDIFRGVCDIFTGLLNPEDGNDSINEYPDAYESAGYFVKLCRARPELTISDVRSDEIEKKLSAIFRIL